jgi:hypothetical protein
MMILSTMHRWLIPSLTKQADNAQRIPIVYDAKRFEVDRLLDVAFNSNGTGILFKVRWAALFNVPSEDTWEPMRGVDRLEIFSDFLRSDVDREISATPHLVRFRNRWHARTTKIP